MRTLILFLVAMLTFMLAAPAFGAVAGTPPELPPNRWVALDLTPHFKKACPTGKWDHSDGYSDTEYRPDTGTVLIWTNLKFTDQEDRKSGFYANGGLEWNPRTDEIKFNWYTNWVGGSGPDAAHPLPAFDRQPTPTPRHSSDLLAYVPSEKALYTLLGANVRIGPKIPRNTDAALKKKAEACFEKDNNGTWRLNVETGQWSWIDHNVKKPLGTDKMLFGNCMTYWPEKNKLLFLDSDGENLCLFDVKTQAWSKSPLSMERPKGRTFYMARSAWDSKRQLWVFRNRHELITLNPATGKFTRLPDPFEAQAFPPLPKGKAVQRQGICYISKHDVYFVPGPTSKETKVFHPDKGTWETINGGEMAMFNGYCQYDVHGDMVVMNFHYKAAKFRYLPSK